MNIRRFRALHDAGASYAEIASRCARAHRPGRGGGGSTAGHPGSLRERASVKQSARDDRAEYCRVVPAQASQIGEQVRSAELVAALCLATDLGMGFPFEHGLHTTVIAMRLGDQLGVDRVTASQTYYACLLAHAGCTTDAHVAAEIFGDSLTTHFNPVMYGSGREVLFGLLRALPQPHRAAPVRAFTGRARAAEAGARSASGNHRGLRGGGDAGGRCGSSPVGGGSAGLSHGALGRHGAAPPREGRADPAADADRPRGH